MPPVRMLYESEALPTLGRMVITTVKRFLDGIFGTVPTLTNYGTDGNSVPGVDDDTAAFLLWAADINEIGAPGAKTGVRSKIPAGTYVLKRTIDFTRSEHKFDTDGTGSRVYFIPGADAYDQGGKVVGVQGVAQFLARYLSHTITEGDRIVVGTDHYVIDQCRDVPLYPCNATHVGNAVTLSSDMRGTLCDGMEVMVGAYGPYTISGFDTGTGLTCTMVGAAWTDSASVCALSTKTLPGTVSRVGNAGTFTLSLAGKIENGSFLSIDGAGYVVSDFDPVGDPLHATLTKPNAPHDATFANGSSMAGNYYWARLTAVNGGSGTFAATDYIVPHVAAFRWRMPNATPWNGMGSLIGRVAVKPFSIIGTETLNTKIGLDFWDSSHCRVDGCRFDFHGNGALGTAGSTLTESIGIRTTGRETFRARDNDISTGQPIELRALYNEYGTSIDHIKIIDNLLLTQVSTRHAIRFRANAAGGNIRIEGNATPLGRGMVKHDGGGAYCQNVSLFQNRFEQRTDWTGFVIDWAAPTHRMTIDDCNLGGEYNIAAAGGIKLRNVNGVTIKNTLYTGGGTATDPGTGLPTAYKVALDVDATVLEINLEGYQTTDGSTSNISDTHEEMWGMQKSNIGAFAPVGYWNVKPATGDGRFLTLGGAKVEFIDTALNYGEQYQCALSLSSDARFANVNLAFHASKVGPFSVTSITRSGTTATLTTSTPHGAPAGTYSRVSITGADQSAYNGAQTLQRTGTNTWTYEVSGSPASPATGTIVAVINEFTAKWDGIWSNNGTAGLMSYTGKVGAVLDDNSVAEFNMCFQYTSAVLQILCGVHWPPVTILGWVMSSRKG